MSGASKQPKPTEPELAGIDVSAEPTNQESVILPYVAGEYTVNGHWLSPVYNQRAVPVPADRPGKK